MDCYIVKIQINFNCSHYFSLISTYFHDNLLFNFKIYLIFLYNIGKTKNAHFKIFVLLLIKYNYSSIVLIL